MHGKVKLFGLLVLFAMNGLAQTPADSITITFRTHKPGVGRNVFVPGEFNGWGPNSNGVISPGAVSQMGYNSGLKAYVKTYRFKINDPADGSRLLGDTVYQYKFNDGGCNTCWYPDPLNAEQYGPDNNSVLRMSRLFWFQFFPEGPDKFTTSKIIIGLVHANSDSIVSIQLSTGLSKDHPLTTVDVTSSHNRSLRILSHTLASPISRLNFIRLVAHNDKGDSAVFETGGVVVEQMPLPGYAKHGVTLPNPSSGDSVTFRLRVPDRLYVRLRVDTVTGNPATAPAITLRDGGGGNWWTNVNLPQGTYEYIYELDDGTRIYDPWGRWNGTNGTRFTVGPAGLTADDYVWNSTGYERPPLTRLILYELHLGEFAGGYKGLGQGQATFQDLIDLLPHFNNLGVNAIELMPINDFGSIGTSGFSWGYDVAHHFALEPQYGTPADFKRLVDSAHSRGIAVLLDVVFNHTNGNAPLWKMQPDFALNPYYKLLQDQRHNEMLLGFGEDMDHFTPETQEYVYEVLKMWIDEYRIDGFRYDFTQGIGWHKDSVNSGILGWANRIASDYNNSIYQIAEHLPESPALIYFSGLTGGWHDAFHDFIFDDARQSPIPSMTTLQNLALDLGAYGYADDVPSNPSVYANRTEPVNHTNNHDEQSLLYEMIRWQNVDTVTAYNRDKVYATFIFTSLGIPMLWQGQEFGEPRGWENGGARLSYRPVRPELSSTPRGKDHFKWYKTLAYQRRYNPALYNGVLKKLRRYDTERVLVWGFDDDSSGSEVVVVANLSGSDRTLSNVPWLSPGTWYDVMNQRPYEFADTINTFFIPKYTAHIFANRPNDSLGIPVSVEASEPTVATDYRLSQNYPNPFNPTTTLRYDIAEAGPVFLAIYDLLGREVRVLVNVALKAGSYSSTWDGRSNEGIAVSSGIYFARMVTNGFAQTRKLVLIK